MRQSPCEVIVTNFNPRFTGVSSTAAHTARVLAQSYDLEMCGYPLPAFEHPISWREAIKLSRKPAEGQATTIWHVRRNIEMQTAIIARDVLRLPIKIVFTSAKQQRHSAWPRWLISKMDAVIATTEGAAKLVPHLKSINPHGVDCELFKPAPDRAAAWAKTGFPGKYGIATVGRLREQKGTGDFVAPMLKVLPHHPDVTAVAFGQARPADQAYLEGLKAKIKAAGLENRILFPGEVSVPKLAEMLPGFSLLVACPHFEPFGMTVLEGMAAGLPFAATDTGCFPDAAEQGRVGLIVPPRAPEALAQAVDTWFSEPARMAEASIAAREVALGRFSIEKEAAGIARVYEMMREEARAEAR